MDQAMAASGGASRRDFLKASAGVAAVGAAAHVLPGHAQAQQGGADADLQRLQGARRILLKGGVVLSMDPRVGDFAEADVLIEDGKLREVRPNVAASGDVVVVDATGTIVVPGFVDTHHHCYQALVRNVIPNGLLNPDYSRDVSNTLTLAYTAEDAYAGEFISALGIIEGGTTTVVDTSQASHTPEHSDAMIRALQESGVRAVYAYSRGDDSPRAQYPRDLVRLQRTYFNTSDQLLTLAISGAFSRPEHPEVLAIAREVGVPVVSHGVSDATEARIMELARAGLLRPGDEYIHCNHLSDDTWHLIRDSGGFASLSVPIEMAMGHGRPAIQDALDHGVRPSLSSDVDVTMAQDPFTNMRSTFTLQRLDVLQRARRGEQNLPPLLTCREVLEFATIEGARCAGLADKVGTLTPGKEADVVLLRADRLNIWPLNNAPGAIVTLMDVSNVDTVFIRGQVRKWRGSLIGVDQARVRRMVADARDALVQRSGYQLDLFA
jgi:cytosine/adenosine deaminase-related metal-dependent hydrolase